MYKDDMYEQDDFSKIRIHDIKGWFETLDPVPHIEKFSGSFNEFGEGSIQGELTDIHGDSTIEGILQEGKLTFVKRYLNGPAFSATITYDYHAVGNGVWDGGFSFARNNILIFTGKSGCETQMRQRNIYDITE